MKSTSLVFAEKPSISSIEPTNLPDRSRWKSHGTHTDITMVRRPNGLWVRSFNSATPSYVEITPTPTQMNFTISAFSILMWIYPDDVSGVKELFTKGLPNSRGYLFRMRDDYLEIITAGGATQQVSTGAASDLTASIWQMVCATRSGASCRLYVNEADTTDAVGTHVNPDSSSETVTIGIDQAKTGNKFDGYISLIKAVNYALPAGKINRIFESQRHRFGV